MKPSLRICILLLGLFAVNHAFGQDEETALQYFQSAAFNAPILAAWEDQSTADAAQFYLPAAKATIRTAMLQAEDPIAAAEADLSSWVGGEIGQLVYRDKVNLSDGTWSVLAYDIDAATTASIMARRAHNRVVVISFVERDPAVRTVMLTMAQAERGRAGAAAEIAWALREFTEVQLSELEAGAAVELPSGEWAIYRGERQQAMGMVFGNDSYVALQDGEIGDLTALADAWNRTLLGFFITPDNTGYLLLGLVAVFVILGMLVFSFVWRSRSINKDLALLDELARENG